MNQVYLAIKTVFKEKIYFLIFVLISIGFFGFFILLPVVTIPGNSIGFQISIYLPRDFLTMTLLAILVGLTFSMQIYIWKKQKKERQLLKSGGRVAISGISGIFASAVGTAACTSCLAFLLGLIGLGGGSVLFVLKNQPYFLGGTIAVMLVTLYFSSRKVNDICDYCIVEKG